MAQQEARSYPRGSSYFKRGAILCRVSVVQLLWFAGCTLQPPYAFVEIQDPGKLAPHATSLYLGKTLDKLQQHPLPKNLALPLEFTVVAKRVGPIALWFEARDAAGNVLARGYDAAIIMARENREDGAISHVVELKGACELIPADLEGRPSCILQGDQDAQAICNTQKECVTSRCGDGLLDENNNETCDDGNEIINDGCLNDCTWNKCGDGKLCSYASCENVPEGGIEQCDDTNTQNTDACLNTCTHALCGDGVTRVDILTDTDVGFEACDKGAENSDAPDAACRTDCSLQRCGDGVKDLGEACDDANDSDTDGCLRDCTLAGCGDGIVRADITDITSAGFEACDDGEANGDKAQCLRNCRRAFCGDDKTCSDGNCTDAIDGPEACDDGIRTKQRWLHQSMPESPMR